MVGQRGQVVEFRKVGRFVYVKGEPEVLAGNGGEQAARLLTGKWLKAPSTDKRFGDLTAFTDLAKARRPILLPRTAR